MARLTHAEQAHNEAAVRAAADQLLRGDLPPGGKCDLKTLAALAGVTRTGFYPKRNRDGTPRPGPYQHLAEDFERRRAALHTAGTVLDPRAGQIERLTQEITRLKDRLRERERQLRELTEFKALAISRLAAQHAEIEQLRRQVPASPGPLRLPSAPRPPLPQTVREPASG